MKAFWMGSFIFAMFFLWRYPAVAQPVVKLPTYYKSKLQRYLKKGSGIAPLIKITETGIYMFASLHMRKKQQPEFFLPYKDVAFFNELVQTCPPKEALRVYKSWRASHSATGWAHPCTSTKPHGQAKPNGLVNFRLAIDPGHLGGSMEMGETEWRFVKLYDGQQPDGNIHFNEGTLTLQTAHILAKLLRQAGAVVMLTKTHNGHSSFGCSFADWAIKEQLAYVEPRYLFHKRFKFLDVRNRARKINEFQPHLAVIIHYNAHENNQRDKDGYLKPVPDNSNMVFVPGSFTLDELQTPESRMFFLYKLTSQQIENSVDAACFLIRQFEQKLGVPAETHLSARPYLQHYSKPTGMQGVFCRNLSMCSFVHYPMVYGESLFQDNLEEARRLSRKDYWFQGELVSKRVYKVALAYFQAIKQYATYYNK